MLDSVNGYFRIQKLKFIFQNMNLGTVTCAPLVMLLGLVPIVFRRTTIK